VADRWATKTANPSTGYLCMPQLDNAPGIFIIVACGGLAGAIAGGSIHTEKWAAAPLDRLRVGMKPLPASRLGLGMSLAF